MIKLCPETNIRRLLGRNMVQLLLGQATDIIVVFLILPRKIVVCAPKIGKNCFSHNFYHPFRV